MLCGCELRAGTGDHFFNTARGRTGLRVRAKLDERAFPKGVEATDEELAEVNLIKDAFHGEWNYTIAPRRRRES